MIGKKTEAGGKKKDGQVKVTLSEGQIALTKQKQQLLKIIKTGKDSEGSDELQALKVALLRKGKLNTDQNWNVMRNQTLR